MAGGKGVEWKEVGGRAAAWAAHRVEVALVELLQGALQLAALRLPLLEVPHGLQGRPLPRGGPGVVVHVVHPAPVIHSSLPATPGQQQ